MGAGASIGLASATEASSAEEIAAFLADISPEARAKLQVALSGLNTSQERLPDVVVRALTEQFQRYGLGEVGYLIFEECMLCFQIMASGEKVKCDESHIRANFAKLDRRSTGKVSLQDWLDHYTEVYKDKLGSEEEIAQTVSKIEKVSSRLERKTKLSAETEAILEDMFNMYDVEKKGFITMEEDKKLTEAMGISYDESCKAHFRQGDVNGDQQVSLKEFINFFKLSILQVIVQEGWDVAQAKTLVQGMCEEVRKAVADQSAKSN